VRLVRLGVALGAVAIAAIVHRRVAVIPFSPGRDPAVTAVVVTSAGLGMTFCGVAVWQLRPRRATGPLLAVAGLAALLSALAGVRPASYDTVGSLAWACSPLVIGLVLLTFPDGLRRRSGIVAILACCLVPATLGVALLHVAYSWNPVRLTPYGQVSLRRAWLEVSDRPELAQWLARLWSGWVVIVAIVIAAATIVRVRRSPAELRPDLTPVAWAGAAWAAATVGSMLFTVRTIGGAPASMEDAQIATFAGAITPPAAAALVALAIVWADIVRPRLDPARHGTIKLAGEPLPVADALRLRLAKAVGDPSVKLAIRGPDSRWLTPSGKPVELRDDRERATAILTRDGDVIAALEHDQALRASPDLVVGATTMAGLAIDNVRLAALDAAQLDEMRNSGAALLAATSRAQRSLASAIGEGPASRLEALARRALHGEDRTLLQRGLRDVATEVRSISHGIYPPELNQAGLSAALDEAVGVPARRYSPAVELTAYLVAVGHRDVRIEHRDGQLIIAMPEPPTAQAAARVAALDGSVVAMGATTTVRIPAPD
jgi:hypothetical protein